MTTYTTSEKKVSDAMKSTLGGIEVSISDGSETLESLHIFTLEDVEMYLFDALDELDKRTLSHVSKNRINEICHQVALKFDYVDDIDTNVSVFHEENDEPVVSPEASSDEMNVPHSTIPSTVKQMAYDEFVHALFMFARRYKSENALERIAPRVKSLFENDTIRIIVFKYWQACLQQDDQKERIFRSIVSGDNIYKSDDWDHDVFYDQVQSYGRVLYDLLIDVPLQLERDAESVRNNRREPR